MKKKIWLHSEFRNSRISGRDIKFLLFSIVLAIVVGAYATNEKIKLIKKDSMDALHFRTQLVESYIKFYSSAVSKFSIGMEENLKLPAYPRNKLNQIKNYPENKSYGIYDNENFSGNLAGNGEIKNLESGVKKELISVLMLDKEIQVLRKYFPQVLWIYYISGKEFIYLVPKVSEDKLLFNPYFYSQKFWNFTIPQNNPNNETTITPLYKDLAGKGLLITISSPVFVDGEFKGVFCLDMGVVELQEFLGAGNSYGETVILSKDRSIVAKAGKIKLGEIYETPSQLRYKGEVLENNTIWLSKPIDNGWLTVVHKLDLKKITEIAIKDTLYIWLILFLLVLLEYMGLKLLRAFRDVTLFMNLDPLTRLVNRRGFYSEFQELEKKYKKAAVLVIDVDYFKKINDSFGHNIGDEILENIGILLESNKRIGDICCRWGGEEFIVILPNCSEEKIIEETKELCARINEYTIKPNGEKITVSVGVTFWHKGNNIDKDISFADENLYKAKESGRNAICYEDKIYKNNC